MNDEEGYQQKHRDEMDGPRGLPAAKQIVQEGKGRIESGRHRQSGYDDCRKQDEQYTAIGQFLQHIVAAGMMKPQPCVVGYVFRQ